MGRKGVKQWVIPLTMVITVVRRVRWERFDEFRWALSGISGRAAMRKSLWVEIKEQRCYWRRQRESEGQDKRWEGMQPLEALEQESRVARVQRTRGGSQDNGVKQAGGRFCSIQPARLNIWGSLCSNEIWKIPSHPCHQSQFCNQRKQTHRCCDIAQFLMPLTLRREL